MNKFTEKYTLSFLIMSEQAKTKQNKTKQGVAIMRQYQKVIIEIL